MSKPDEVRRRRFDKQKANAKQRGVPWRLSFEEWCGIWDASGKWQQRGIRRGQYVMARYGDNGAYEAGNVRICTNGANNREGDHGAPRSRTGMRGDPRVSDRLRMALSVMGCTNYDDAAKLLDVSKAAINSWLNGYTLIPVPEAMKLAEHGFNLDWVYRGPVVRFKDGERPFHRGRPRKGEPA